MTSRRQLVANRRNAGKSTGPRTVAGKFRSRHNATRHGFSASTVDVLKWAPAKRMLAKIMPNAPKEFEAVFAGEAEAFVVSEVLSCQIRSARVAYIEGGVGKQGHSEHAADPKAGAV